MKQFQGLSALMIVLFLIWSYGYADSKTEQLVKELNKQIEKSVEYDLAKTLRIKALHQQLRKTSNLSSQFELTKSIYKEYEVFSFDSAFLYVSKLQDLGKALKNPEKIQEARIDLCFVLLSSGMFKETSEVINTVDASILSDIDLAGYYFILARFNLDLAQYNSGSHFSSQYYSKSILLLDSCLRLYDRSSFGYLYSYGLKCSLSGEVHKAKEYLDNLYFSKHLSLRQRALVASTMSPAYLALSLKERSVELLLEAAIADVRACTKEETALSYLAKIFYERGDYNTALIWIEKAHSNASYYGARQRNLQLVPLMQAIQSAKIKSEETKRTDLLRITAVICLILAGVVVFSLVFYRQVQKLRAIRIELMTVNEKLNLANEKNETYIERLQKNNKALREAERIKEEYISYFIHVDSELFDKVGRLKKAIEKKASENKMSEVLYLINRFSLESEKKDILKNFDKVFLRIFPDFVESFNSLFAAKDKIVLKEQDLLNTELRIFALIRMGITNNDTIAQILEYSVNTIYAYKTKIKNRALVPNDEFEEKLNQLVQVGQD